MTQFQPSDLSGSQQLDYCKQNQGRSNSAAFQSLGDANRWKHLDQWTGDEVASWLCAIGLVNCAAQVRSHDIGGDVVGDVTFEDAKEMGLREIDAYRLIRALGELQVLVNEVWRQPNQLSDRLKIDSLQHHHTKLSFKRMNGEMPHESKCVEQGSFENLQSNSETEATCTTGKVTKAPQSPQTPLQLPIKKRVRFNDQVQCVAI